MPNFNAPQLTRLEVMHVAYTVSGDLRWSAEAVVVAECESGLRRGQVGAQGEQGLWQIHPVHGAVPSDPYAQAVIARALWEDQGWTPWSCKP